MAEITGKHNLELNIVGDGRIFLNFWDWAHGNDVVAEIEGKALRLTEYKDDDMEVVKYISFEQFVELVKESIQKRTV